MTSPASCQLCVKNLPADEVACNLPLRAEHAGFTCSTQIADLDICSVESVMGGPSLGSKRMPMKQTQTERGVNNANSRRWRAFRAGLVRAVALLHDSFLQQRRDSGANIADTNGDDEDNAPQKVCHHTELCVVCWDCWHLDTTVRRRSDAVAVWTGTVMPLFSYRLCP